MGNLAESERRFRNLVEALPDAVLVHCGNKIVFVNPCCVQLHGAKSAEQLIGRDISEFISLDDLSTVRQRIEECYRTGNASIPLESTLITCEGSAVAVETTAIPMVWNGAPAIEVVLRDIRTRKQAEEALHKWHQRLELAQKSGLRIGLWDWDVTADTVVWSDESYRQFGFTRETFSGRVEDAMRRVHPQDREKLNLAIGNVLEGKTDDYSAQYRLVRPDGTTCWIDAHGVIVRSGTTHMMGIGVDISELKEAEEKIQTSEEKYRNLFENAAYGIFLAKPNGELMDANPALVAMLGYSSKEELLTRNLERDIYEDSEVRRSILRAHESDARVIGVETNWRRKDGKTITVRMNGGVFRGSDGRVLRFEVMVEDITERRSLEAQFRQSQKMEAVGLLAGGISHDFNNLLGVILGNADLLLETAEAGPQQKRAEAIKQAGRSAAQLIRQLLAFSRKQVLYPSVMDLNAVVGDIGKILRRLIGEDVRVATDLETALGSIQADRGQIEQILLNLATNARDAMPGGGTFSIRTENAELGPEDVARYPYVKPGRYVHLAASDNGSGMSEEIRSRVFEPFFTTKEKGRGTGLGLATVYGIVKQSGGYIWVKSSPGEGATFDIYLPRIDEKAAVVVKSEPSPSEYPRGTETILLLEDEDCLRQVTREFLTASGYNVLEAGHGEVAIEWATVHKGPIPLIISDVVMPEMSGPSAIARLRVVHPEIKALYVSGYAEVPVAQQLIAEGAVLLQKPVSRMDLLKKVDEMLHERKGREAGASATPSSAGS
jgi:two-component system, cell cycle sensor histidine kinase and response regulator CckA